MGTPRSLALRASIAAATVLSLAGCFDSPLIDCTVSADCPTSLACRRGVCAAVPCTSKDALERCTAEELCLQAFCTARAFCVPVTCGASGKNCGQVDDGCGGVVDCGGCTPPETCGGGGAFNVCGCTPTTCALQGTSCGPLPDGCGGTLDCGRCPAPPPNATSTCLSGNCVVACDAPYFKCGSVCCVLTSIAAGGRHTCGVTSVGGVKCWGDNSAGQLGDGTSTQRPSPVDVVGLDAGVSLVAAGNMHTCAVTTTGHLQCWGDNGLGQLGDGTSTGRHLPTEVPGISNVMAFATGTSHTCAVTRNTVDAGADSTLKCWGNNLNGQLGDGTTLDRRSPVVVSSLGDTIGVCAGDSNTCAVSGSGVVRCWGSNLVGEIGDGTTVPRPLPTAVIGIGEAVTRVHCGVSFACAQTATAVKCWGWNRFGQLGDGTTLDRPTPVDVPGLRTSNGVIATGDGHACEVDVMGPPVCWGDNSFGQLGDGTTTRRLAPTDVAGMLPASEISAGRLHTCAVTAAGEATCWGENSHGQLGDGSTANRSVPGAVARR